MQSAVPDVLAPGLRVTVSLGVAGDTAVAESPTPHAVETVVLFTAVAAGGTHNCAVAQSGALYCWGNGSAGQLGTRPPDDCSTETALIPCSRLPISVDGGLSFRSVTGGNHHTCGLTVDDVAYCWGLNDHGQLGDGTRTTRIAPVRVATQVGVP